MNLHYFMVGLGVLMQLVGLVGSVAAFFSLLALIFRKSGALWGLASLCIPLVYLVWLVRNWPDARSPFLRGLAGSAVYGVGAGLCVCFAQTP